MPDIQTDFNLAPYNTLAIPARARYFVSLDKEGQLPEALSFARQQGLALLVMGGGSNLVLKEDFPGLVIHVNWQGKEVVDQNGEHTWLEVAAGENWHGLVEHCLRHQYWGLENLSLIPGSVGAAPIQNIGAYGVELDQVFSCVRATHIDSGQSREFNREQCEFGYRSSVFKGKLRDQYVITSVTLKLSRTPSLKIAYPSLHQALEAIPSHRLTPIEVSQAVCRVRREKLPDPTSLPNVGSFFKNPVVGLTKLKQLQARFPGLVSYALNERQAKLAAGWLIEQAGWKGFSQGAVAVHDRQALVLTNPGRALGRELLALAERIQASVEAKFDVRLDPEPRIYP